LVKNFHSTVRNLQSCHSTFSRLELCHVTFSISRHQTKAQMQVYGDTVVT